MLKVLPLIAVVIIAVMFAGRRRASQRNPLPDADQSAGIAGAAALTLWAMHGFECASHPGAARP